VKQIMFTSLLALGLGLTGVAKVSGESGHHHGSYRDAHYHHDPDGHRHGSRSEYYGARYAPQRYIYVQPSWQRYWHSRFGRWVYFDPAYRGYYYWNPNDRAYVLLQVIR